MFKGAMVMKHFGYDKVGSWRRGDPFAVAYIYPKSNKKALHRFTGSWKTIEEKIVEYGLRPCIVYAYFYCRGETRLVARVLYNEKNSNYNIYLHKDGYRDDNKGYHKKHWHLIVFDRKDPCIVLERRYRKPPRNWLNELNEYV